MKAIVLLVMVPLWASAAAAAPQAPPTPPPPPPQSTDPCAGTAVASIQGRAAQRGWSCGAVHSTFDSTAGYKGGTYSTPSTSVASCNEGMIVWNPYKGCAYTIVNALSGASGKIYERWSGSAEVRAFVGYPAEDGIPLKANPVQRFDYGYLANDAANSGAFVIGGRATVTGSATTSVRFPTSEAGVPGAQLQAFLSGWGAYPGYTGGTFTSYKRPSGNTQYVATNGGGFLTTIDGTLIGAGNDATIAIKSGAGAAHHVAGAVQDYWLAHAGVGGVLRWPASSTTAIPGGSYASFEGTVSEGCTSVPCAAVYASTVAGTHAVDGQILMQYQGAGGPAGALAFPLADAAPATAFPRAQHFRGGAVAALTAGFSYLLPGAIGHYWYANGGGSGWVGWPTDQAFPITSDVEYQAFGRATLYRAGAVAFGVEGAPLSPILAKYLALGGPTGYLGLPTNTAPHSGTSIYPRTQTFQHGSITAISATSTSFAPHAPAAFLILGWGAEVAGLSWQNRSAPQTLVIRSVDGGPWTTIHSYGELQWGTVTTYEAPAERNAENCYKVVGTDGSQQTPSPERCVFTRDGRGILVSRLRLRIRVPDGPVGGLWPQTDGWVQVRLQSNESQEQWRPAGNSTWLDSTVDDFEMGSDGTYDLRLTRGLYDQSAISELSDVTRITVNVPGSDGLCIAELTLLADEHPVFNKVFGDATCAWADEGTPVSIDFHELRRHELWQAARQRTPSGLDGPALRSLVEATFGNALHDQGGHLRDGHPTVTQFIDESRVHVQTNIVALDGWWGEVDATVDFDLALQPQAGGPTQLHVENIDPDSQYGGLPVLDAFVNLVFTVIPILDYTADLDIEKAMEHLGGASLGVPPANQHFCFVGQADPVLTVCPN